MQFFLLALFAVSSLEAASANILVPGLEPLTKAKVEEVAYFLCDVLDLPQEKLFLSSIRQMLVQKWQSGNMAIPQRIRKAKALLAEAPTDQRILRRIALRQEFLEGMQSVGKDDLQSLLCLHDSHHPPIARGTPSLYLHTAEAWHQLHLLLMAGNSPGRTRPYPQEEFIRSLALRYHQLDSPRKQLIQDSPLILALLESKWSSWSSQKRELVLSSLRSRIIPSSEDQYALKLHESAKRTGGPTLRSRLLQQTWEHLQWEIRGFRLGHAFSPRSSR